MRSTVKTLASLVGFQVAALTLSHVAGAQEPARKPAPHLRSPQGAEHLPAKAQDRVGEAPNASPIQRAVAALGPETKNFQGWQVACDPMGQGPNGRNCIAKMTVIRGKDDPRPILLVSIVKSEGSSVLVLQTPTSVDLKPGVELEVGKSAVRHLDYVSCEPALCSAAMPLDDGLVRDLSDTPSAVAKWTGLGVGEVRVEYQLQEFRNALAFLTAR